MGHKTPYWATGKGKGTADTVWRQALQAEAAVAQEGQCAACTRWGRRAFFEHINCGKLRDRALAFGVPPPLVRLALSIYR